MLKCFSQSFYELKFYFGRLCWTFVCLYQFDPNFLFVFDKFYGFKRRQVIYHPTFCGVIFNKINSLGMYDFQGKT